MLLAPVSTHCSNPAYIAALMPIASRYKEHCLSKPVVDAYLKSKPGWSGLHGTNTSACFPAGLPILVELQQAVEYFMSCQFWQYVM